MVHFSYMQKYKIEKGIKIPKPAVGVTNNQPSKAALTMRDMKKGESFLVSDPLDSLRADKVVRDHNTRERARGGSRQFTTRRSEKGLRIWRTK